MMTMMMMTMTMMTVGRRYEYTRSNDRMWRKNTVGIWLVIIIMRMKTMLKITIASYNQAHMPIIFHFSEFCVFLGGKPWFILHRGRFESQLSWRVRIQMVLVKISNGSLWKIKPCNHRYGVGASRDPCSEVFQGPHPFSEAESRALRLTNRHVFVSTFFIHGPSSLENFGLTPGSNS